MKEIIRMKFGSHLYGTNTPESDLDLKAIYIPEPKEIILGTAKQTILQGRSKQDKERNTKDDVDVEIFSLQRFVNLLMDGQTVALDMVFAPEKMFLPLSNGDHSHEIWRELIENRDKLINKNVSAFIGYARQQAAKYGVKGSRMDALKQIVAILDGKNPYSRLEEHMIEIEEVIDSQSRNVTLGNRPLISIVMLENKNQNHLVPHLQVCDKNYPYRERVKDIVGKLKVRLDEYGARAYKAHLNGGKDWKALSHAVRVNSEGLELLKTGNITFPRPDRELLLKIKTGQMAWEETSEIIEQGLKDLVEAEKTSTLRAEPDREWAEEFVFDVYECKVKGDSY